MALKALALVALACVAVLAGCDKKSSGQLGAADSQVVAQVNDGEISVHQVQTLLRVQPALAARWGDQATARALDNLIEQELAAQAAREGKLDRSPQVIQALALAEREVLARAYQDQLADKVVPPDSEAINRYFDEHPELFSERKQYHMEETVVRATAAEADAALPSLAATTSLDAVQALLNQKGWPRSSRRTSQWAENVPLEMLPRLAKLQVGQSLAMRRPEGLVVLTLLRVDAAAVTLPQATKVIYSVLLNQRRQQAVQEGMLKLREQAKIVKATPAAASAASTSSSASAPMSAPASTPASAPEAAASGAS
ncbi:MAG: EpsD family peptidyl-prolyl cis-trans isomerase [Burkholderiales bacterium]|nr:EpsD family peptidyl-prolyl cis-trans isomerase [Burkholderiales bacterium]MBH2017054.1 EpsD family peptidyl-prolyl cis-trans isomerase [Burkholderiales bacterium]